MAEQIVIDVQGTATVDHQRPEQAPDPKRRRPAEYVPATPAVVDLGELIAAGNPYWSAEANADAEANPQIKPKDLARKWAAHRIEAA